ncbi:MAG: Lambda phage tail tube protein [Pseudomonadota bacterium]|jgi:hypothetical protein
MAKLGLGATFKLHNGTTLTAFGEVTGVTPPVPKGSAVETTNHGITGGTRTFIPGLIEVSDIVVKGNCNAGDATYLLAIGRIAARASTAFEMSIPGASGGATGAYKYAGTCIPLSMEVGDVTPEGLVPYTFTGKPDGPVTETAI